MRVQLYLLVLVLLSACQQYHSELQVRASSLKPGMTKSEVMNVFAGCTLVVQKQGAGQVGASVKLLSQSREYNSMLAFKPKRSRFLEWCKLYFNEEGIIVGYEYELMD